MTTQYGKIKQLYDKLFSNKWYFIVDFIVK